MKKFFRGLGIVALVVVIGFVGLIVWGYFISSDKQEAFFEKINAGDVVALEEMMSPLLRLQVNSVVLAAVVEEVRDVLGTYEGPGVEGFDANAYTAGDQLITIVTGTAKFSKGETPVELIYVGDQLLGFDIQNKEVVSGAFTRPEVEDEFKARGLQFFESALGDGQEEAYEMLHEEVRTQVSKEQFLDVVKETLALYGPLQSVTFSALKNEAVETGHMKIYYDMVYENAAMAGQIDFVFNGMLASIVSFHFSM